MFKSAFKSAIRFVAATALVSSAALSTASAANDGATGRVAVSVPALHSLVSHLLAGVDSPDLLFADIAAKNALVPDTQGRTKIDTAKMVIWVGPEHEPALAGLRTIDPAASTKGLTLTTSTPLLSLPGTTHGERVTGIQDQRFWLDPRLAKVAVGRIAPNLVRLYPDHVERIMDNEIALKKRLKMMEHHFRHTLGTPVGVPLTVPESDVLYLAWRFNLAVPNCPAGAKTVTSFKHAPGQDYYFNMMETVLADLKACQV